MYCDVLLHFLLDMFGECFECQQQGYMLYFASLGISFQTQNKNAFVWLEATEESLTLIIFSL
jgi:hypothetical protein